MFIVQLEKGCWIADWFGDPGRTIVKESAQVFECRHQAEKALKKAKKQRPFINAVIEKVFERT